jgi:hypothetical protein
VTLGRTSFRDLDAEFGRELSALDALHERRTIADWVGDPDDLHATGELVENLLHLALLKLAQNTAQDVDLAPTELFREFEVTTTTRVARRIVTGFLWCLALLWCWVT